MAGSALNQLAVISTYLNDDFATIYYYIRALAIRVPFKGIGEILEKFLKKAFDRYTDDQIPADEAQAVRGWKLELGALISVLYRQNEWVDFHRLGLNAWMGRLSCAGQGHG